MSLLYPGPQSRRSTRASTLHFYWRASDGRLVSQTGQPMTFNAALTNPGSILGRNGSSVTVGRLMPRFTMQYDNVVRLTCERSYDEYVSVPLEMQVGALTLYVKMRHRYAFGSGGDAQPGNIIAKLGVGTSDGGYLRVARSSDGIVRATRENVLGGAATAASPAEVFGWVLPYEILVTLTAAGQTKLQIMDGGGTLRANVSGATVAAHANTSQSWDGQVFTFGGGAGATDEGGGYDFEMVKIARGDKTLDQMRVMA